MKNPAVHVYFSDAFGVSPDDLEAWGAFNICLITDLPLFVDPFLLFSSDKAEYLALHDDIIKYLRFLRDRSVGGKVTKGLLKAWYHFKEVDENCMGFCKSGHSGRGLGPKFAKALDNNLQNIFGSFGKEQITDGSHLEKLCLIEDGVGKDMISDFTTNLIKDFLCKYTQGFALKYLAPEQRKKFSVQRAMFNYELGVWQAALYELPRYEGRYVLLTPVDILTKDDTWINKSDLIHDFDRIPSAIDNDVQRAQINDYFQRLLPKDPEKKDYERAASRTYIQFPELIDYFIRFKENTADNAKSQSLDKVEASVSVYVKQFGMLIQTLANKTGFYGQFSDTEAETKARIEFFKDAVENKGCHRIFYHKGSPLTSEDDVQILFRMTWFAPVADVTREANDGRGPVDFKISRGAKDKTLVEFKLASNTKIKRNLEKQLEVYQKASDAPYGFKVIIFFTDEQKQKVSRILRELGLDRDDHVYLIDARMDNKPSGSNA